MNIVLIGAVNSSLRLLEKLIEQGMPPTAVFGYQSENISHISGYENLEPTASQAGIEFNAFVRINDCFEQLKSYEPDLIFVVGLSQLVSEEIIKLPRHGCVGFHPTALPLGRGRAPLAWILLDDCPAAATFFRIGAGVDDGPVFVQKPIDVESSDDVGSLTEKVLSAIDAALDDWLPQLKNEEIFPREQNHSKATYYGKRVESDGKLALGGSAESVFRLIRATSRPYPGAYLLFGNLKIRVWKAEIVRCTITAVPGSIVDVDQGGNFTIQTGCGHVRVTDCSIEGGDGWEAAPGMRFDVFTGMTWPVKTE